MTNNGLNPVDNFPLEIRGNTKRLFWLAIMACGLAVVFGINTYAEIVAEASLSNIFPQAAACGAMLLITTRISIMANSSRKAALLINEVGVFDFRVRNVPIEWTDFDTATLYSRSFGVEGIGLLTSAENAKRFRHGLIAKILEPQGNKIYIETKNLAIDPLSLIQIIDLAQVQFAK